MVDTSDLERTPVQLAVREAIAVAMETPLREPILEAVEATVGSIDDESFGEAVSSAGEEPIEGDETAPGGVPTDHGGSDRTVTPLRRLATFLVMVAVVYTILRKLTGNGE